MERPSRFHFIRFTIPLSAFSESIRTLRSGILMSDVDTPPKVIHVTSSSPSEGKSTIAVSLAISAAGAGQKVVLVDADLRHPSTSRFFKMEQQRGLVDFLTGGAKLTDIFTVKVRQPSGYSCRREEPEPARSSRL